MYRYTFVFILKLTTTLFQMWNVKQKDDGMEQKTLHCYYGDYLPTYQET